MRPVPALAFAAALSAALALPPAAEAGGSLTVQIAPQSAEHREALALGLALYGLASGGGSGAEIRQTGRDNAAAIAQRGRGHLGVVHQDGRGHAATLRQRGRGHAMGVFQFGRNADLSAAQRGAGQSGLVLQYGW